MRILLNVINDCFDECSVFSIPLAYGRLDGLDICSVSFFFVQFSLKLIMNGYCFFCVQETVGPKTQWIDFNMGAKNISFHLELTTPRMNSTLIDLEINLISSITCDRYMAKI
jgi:hypothetical protein